MHLHAYLAQALPPAAAVDNNQFLRSLEGKDDPTVNDIKKTVIERWDRVEIVDTVFKGLQSFAWHSFYIVLLTQH
jgi:hypothetical protein